MSEEFWNLGQAVCFLKMEEARYRLRLEKIPQDLARRGADPALLAFVQTEVLAGLFDLHAAVDRAVQELEAAERETR